MKNLKARLLLVPVIALLAGLLVFAAACGDDDDEPSAEEIQEVEDVIRQLFEAGGDDIDYVLEHATDNLLSSVFFATREECQAAPDDCLGEGGDTLDSITETEIDGDEASAIAAAPFGTFRVSLVREDDVWKGDSLSAVSDELADGLTTVDLSLIDFGFSFDEGDIPSDGNFGFAITNDGEQPHEVIIAKVPADLDLEAALASDEEPEGVEDVAAKVFIAPGQELDMSLGEAPLGAGRYVLLCFFPDTEDDEMTPHALKGMLAEFTLE